MAAALDAQEFVVERKGGTKAGRRGSSKYGRKKKAPKAVDLRWALQDLQACSAAAASQAGVPAEVLPVGQGAPVVLRLRTAFSDGNPVLTPAMAVTMVNAAAASVLPQGSAPSSSSGSSSGSEGEEVEEGAGAEEGGTAGGSGVGGRYALAHIHRSDLRLRPMTVPQPDFQKLRSLLRMEGHLGAAQQNGQGPWTLGLENRPTLV